MSKKVVLITGASSGIGYETAKLLVEKGFCVYASARRTEPLEELAQLGAHPVELDVTEAAECRRCVEEIVAAEGRIDVLFNNAGFALYGAVEDISLEDAAYQLQVNVMGMAAMIQAVLPHMRRQHSGRIINNSSVGGKVYTPLAAWYHASKHAVEGFSDCLRLETGKYGIDIVVIEPGTIQTEFYDVGEKLILKNSGQGAYRDLAGAMAASLRNINSGAGMLGGSSPAGVAAVVVKAIEARRPRTRYVTGNMARTVIAGRRLMSDRMFDRVIMKQTVNMKPY